MSTNDCRRCFMLRLGPCVFVLAALLLTQPAGATVYNDAIGDEFTGFGFLDIVSVEIQNDATDIMFTITLAGDPIANDWGKYLVAIDRGAGGDTTSNPWARPISMSSGMDYFIGSWVDFGNGAETYSWNGSAWDLDQATYNPPSDIDIPATTPNSVKLTTTLASLALGVGDSFVFDVFTTGGGGTDTAIDAVSDPLQTVTAWDAPYDSRSTVSYTVVPEPVGLVMILIGFGAITWWRDRCRG